MEPENDFNEAATTMTTTISEFVSWLDSAVDAEFGGWERLEKSQQVAGGNTTLKACHVGNAAAWKLAKNSMEKAQYGRARPMFVEQAMKAAEVGPDSIVVDIGSGVGSVVFQASLMCKEAIGIELCKGRYEAAMQLKPLFEKQYPTSNVSFFQGDFREPTHFDLCKQANVLFVNNAEAVFSARSVVIGSQTLDWHVARLACALALGSRLICFESLVDLEQGKLKECFTRSDHVSEPGATSWTEISGKRSKFVVYVKIADVWTCEMCNTNHLLLRSSGNEWGEIIQDTCQLCTLWNKKNYPIRKRIKT